MQPTQKAVIERPDELSADWLTDAVGAGKIADFTVERIGTGQMSECYRIELTYADADTGPGSVVLKVAATDQNSRQTGLALGLYEREVRFYADVAPGLVGPLAPCYHAEFDPATGAFDLLLGDAGPAVVGDEIRGAGSEHATLALVELARLHAPLLGDTALTNAAWLNRESPLNQALIGSLHAGFVERYRDRIAPEHHEVCERLVAGFDAYLAAESSGLQGLVHGDYRLDNMLFGQPGADRTLTVVDWQTVTWGPAMTDVAYFLGCALTVENRRAHYETLLRAYHAALGPDAPVSLDDVRDGVRHQSFFGVMMAIVSPMLVERTERGDQMFMAMLQRHCQHVRDTGALDILAPAAQPEPLVPSPDDEGPHPPTDEPLWNESWYFDFADVPHGTGGWVRLGLYPNERTVWINALLCGPDMPTVSVTDLKAALPDSPARVRTSAVELTLSATTPLQTYTVSVCGTGEAHDDPAALLRGESGRPVDVVMELTWTTSGVPYQYRLTPRYEIPCTVSGTVTADERRYHLDSVPGQRDHSWGVRDWWSMDWVWSALHLDDGTHLHAVDIRIPGAPRIGIGYIQPPGAALAELNSVSARETFGDNGLPLGAILTLEPGNIVASIDVKGHAPVRLTAADGRISQFPRAWVGVTTGDGRIGTGWVEWNRNQ